MSATFGPVGVVFEVLEHQQPHNMGWPEPPPITHGLYATREGAKAKRDQLARRHILATSTVERTVLG